MTEKPTDLRPRVAFAVAMGQVVDGVLRGSLSFEAAAARLRAGATWCEGQAKGEEQAPPEDSAKLGPTMDEVRAVFDFWRTATKRPRAELPQSRVRIIRSALKVFSAAQLNHITLWATRDDHYSGGNDRGKRYDVPETMFRSVARIEDLLERSGWKGSCVEPADVSSAEAQAAIDREARLDDLKRRAREALEDDRIEDHNRLQEEIRATQH